jgi:hypothetical protein
MPLMHRLFVIIAIVVLMVPMAAGEPQPLAKAPFDLARQVAEYRHRFPLTNPYTKLVDNRGKQFPALEGVRNFRVVLDGVYYRGGADNSQRTGPKANMNPLPTHGLQHLCEQGFTEAVYLYSTNCASAPHDVACQSDAGSGALEYQRIVAQLPRQPAASKLLADNDRNLLTPIYEHLKGTRPGPIYMHCWNGWHASGYVAAIALRQFCEWSADAAIAYWTRNTDGNGADYGQVPERIKTFAPIPKLAISDSERRLVCPADR